MAESSENNSTKGFSQVIEEYGLSYTAGSYASNFISEVLGGTSDIKKANMAGERSQNKYGESRLMNS